MSADFDKDLAATPLAIAVANNDADTVKALIKAGTDLRPVNWYDTPVLVTAAEHGSVEIVQLLIAARANVNNGYEQLPLCAAAAHGHLKVVRLLLEAGAYLEAQDGHRRTALMAAAAAGHLAVVRFLVENGAQLTPVGAGESALSLAAKGGHQSTYVFLKGEMTLATAAAVPEAPTQPPQTAASAMDEMITSAAEELNELLTNDNSSTTALSDGDLSSSEPPDIEPSDTELSDGF